MSRDTTLIPDSSATNRITLPYLDALRALAALWVLWSHTYAKLAAAASSRHWAVPVFIARPMECLHATYAVAVFIVLSGYCLMLPVASSADKELRGGLPTFVRRRARRILPPYYASVLMSMALIYLSHRTKGSMGIHDRSDVWALNLRPGVVFSHLLLVHNLYEPWSHGINTTLWSVAPEWQIYFLFALILLPIRRRLGMGAAVLLSLAMGTAPHLFLPRGHDFDWTAPWFISLFAFGMAAAWVNFADTRIAVAGRAWIPWPAISATLVVVLLAACWLTGWSTDEMGIHLLIGVTLAVTLVHLTIATMRGDSSRSALLTCLASRPFVILGAFSYSLYLTQDMVLPRVNTLLVRFTWPPAVFAACYILVMLGACLVFAYCFHLAFERRFMSR